MASVISSSVGSRLGNCGVLGASSVQNRFSNNAPRNDRAHHRGMRQSTARQFAPHTRRTQNRLRSAECRTELFRTASQLRRHAATLEPNQHNRNRSPFMTTSTEAKKRSSDKVNEHDSKKQKMSEKVAASSDSEVEAEKPVEEPVEESFEEEEEEERYDGDKQDETLNCRDCESEFIFSVGEQEFFESKGFDNKPSRCSDCKAAKKASRDGGGQRDRGAGVCYAFQKGQCDRGDSCRFSHSSGGDSGDRGFGGRSRGACYSYQKGNCRYGDSCRFSHSDGGGQEDDGYRGGRSSGRGQGVCYSFQKGNCNYGDSCRFSH